MSPAPTRIGSPRRSAERWRREPPTVPDGVAGEPVARGARTERRPGRTGRARRRSRLAAGRPPSAEQDPERRHERRPPRAGPGDRRRRHRRGAYGRPRTIEDPAATHGQEHQHRMAIDHRRRRRDMSDDHGADWSAGFRRGTDAELRGWLEVAQAACDEADAIARRHFRRDLHIETKPDRTFVTEADTAIEPRIRERLARRLPRPRPGRRGVRHRSRRRERPLVHRPDRRHPQLHARRARCSARSSRSSATASCRPRSSPRRPSDERWWAHRGGGAWARDRGDDEPVDGSRSSRGHGARAMPRSCTAARRDIAHVRAAPGFEACSTSVWRERGFGDFWGYTLLAEGAAEAMVEVGLKSLGRGRAVRPRRGGRRSGDRLRRRAFHRQRRPSWPATASSTTSSWSGSGRLNGAAGAAPDPVSHSAHEVGPCGTVVSWVGRRPP